jgi:hypothetical protein
MEQAVHLYAIAIGSNRPHGRHGRPTGVVQAAIAELDRAFDLFDASPLMLNPASAAWTTPVGRPWRPCGRFEPMAMA